MEKRTKERLPTEAIIEVELAHQPLYIGGSASTAF